MSRRCVRHTIYSSFCAYFYALSIELNLYDSIFGSFCVRSENRFTQVLAKFEALWWPYSFIILNFVSYLGADMCFFYQCANFGLNRAVTFSSVALEIRKIPFFNGF